MIPFPRLRLCGRSRSVEFTITNTIHLSTHLLSSSSSFPLFSSRWFFTLFLVFLFFIVSSHSFSLFVLRVFSTLFLAFLFFFISSHSSACSSPCSPLRCVCMKNYLYCRSYKASLLCSQHLLFPSMIAIDERGIPNRPIPVFSGAKSSNIL